MIVSFKCPHFYWSSHLDCFGSSHAATHIVAGWLLNQAISLPRKIQKHVKRKFVQFLTLKTFIHHFEFVNFKELLAKKIERAYEEFSDTASYFSFKSLI